MNVDALAFQRPALRGTLHLFAAFAAIGGTVWLLLIADSPTGYVGAAMVYRRLRGRCPRCGYDIQPHVPPGCSECGWRR